MGDSVRRQVKPIPVQSGVNAVAVTDIDHGADFASPTGQIVTVVGAEAAPTLVTDGVDSSNARYVIWGVHTLDTITSYTVTIYVYDATSVKWMTLTDTLGNAFTWNFTSETPAMPPIPCAGWDRVEVNISAMVGTDLIKVWKVI